MFKDCSQISHIANSLITDIAKVTAWWGGLRQLNPGFEQLSEEDCYDRESSLWIHGETHAFEANELQRWLYVSPPTSQTADSLAMDHYLKWSEHLLEEGVYADFSEGNLPRPHNGETLSDYVVRLSAGVEATGWGSKKQERALKCFLHYLRTKNDQKEIAFIEHIFPEKCDLRGGRIIRIIRPQTSPISVQTTGAIVKELIHQCAHGRPNARHHSGEALALVWLCLSASRIRWPRSLESVHAINNNALLSKSGLPHLHVPSIFGPHSLRISSRVSEFLQAVSRIPSKNPRNTILQTPLPDLRQPLRRALAKIDLPPGVGEISFSTFLSHPHYYGENIR